MTDLDEVSFAGRDSVGGIFQVSQFQRWLERNIDIPVPIPWPHDDIGTRLLFDRYFISVKDNYYTMRPYPERNIVKRSEYSINP